MPNNAPHSFSGCNRSLNRRSFLSTLVTSTAGLAGSTCPVLLPSETGQASETKRQQKNVILLWLAGAPSQLETWDPKPGTATGGPFRAIQTSIPGVRISELMPRMAQRLGETVLIRSLDTRDGEHGAASKLMMKGRRDEGNLIYPDMGAVLARELGSPGSQVPDYVHFYFETAGREFSLGESGFLGARYSCMELNNGMIPDNLARLKDISEPDHRQRAQLREQISSRFSRGRSSVALATHTEAYTRVQGLMANEKLFDIHQEPERIRELYGPTEFGQQALVARRLIEAGVPFIRVSRVGWDSHAQNFETHQEMVPELDHVLFTLLEDLKQRGLLETTLVLTMAEFGRTPEINPTLGRDHFASAWSIAMSGCGIQGGAVYGKTDSTGHQVVDGKVGAGEVLATILTALGINPQKNYYHGSRPVPLVNPGIKPIREVLA